MVAKRAILKKGRSSNRGRAKKPVVLFVAGGRQTERQYVKGVLQPAFPGLVLKVIAKDVDPLTLARHALKIKDQELEGYAAVFVITDVDDFSAERLRDAEALCTKSGMALVVSNPCFEVWLVDHDRPCPAGCYERVAVQRMARDLGFTAGRRDKEIETETLMGKVEGACENALGGRSTEMQRARYGLSDLAGFAPWTDMPEVIAKLHQLEDGAKS